MSFNEKLMTYYLRLNNRYVFLFISDRAEEDKESRRKQVRPLFRHFRRIDACLQPREAFRGSDESML